MKQKKLLITFFVLVIMLIIALSILFIKKDGKVEKVKVEDSKVLVKDEKTGIYSEDFHISESNNEKFALDKDKENYSVGDLVFGEPKDLGIAAKADVGGKFISGNSEMALMSSYPYYIYKFDYATKEAVWLTTVGSAAYLTKGSDLTLYFEYTDIASKDQATQRISTFNNNNAEKKVRGTLEANYEPVQGMIADDFAFYTATKDYGVTKQPFVLSLSDNSTIATSLQNQLTELKITYMKESNGNYYFASDITKKIYQYHLENHSLTNIGEFEGEKITDIAINGDIQLVAAENNSIVTVYQNGKKIKINGYINGVILDQKHLVTALYGGIYLYNIETGEKEGLVKGLSDYYIEDKKLYYFDGKTRKIYVMKMLNH